MRNSIACLLLSPPTFKFNLAPPAVLLASTKIRFAIYSHQPMTLCCRLLTLFRNFYINVEETGGSP